MSVISKKAPNPTLYETKCEFDTLPWQTSIVMCGSYLHQLSMQLTQPTGDCKTITMHATNHYTYLTKSLFFNETLTSTVRSFVVTIACAIVTSCICIASSPVSAWIGLASVVSYNKYHTAASVSYLRFYTEKTEQTFIL